MVSDLHIENRKRKLILLDLLWIARVLLTQNVFLDSTYALDRVVERTLSRYLLAIILKAIRVCEVALCLLASALRSVVR